MEAPLSEASKDAWAVLLLSVSLGWVLSSASGFPAELSNPGEDSVGDGHSSLDV